MADFNGPVNGINRTPAHHAAGTIIGTVDDGIWHQAVIRNFVSDPGSHLFARLWFICAQPCPVTVIFCQRKSLEKRIAMV